MIKLELTVDEVNGVLGALGKLPFEVSAGLIKKVQEQAAPQVQAQNEEAPDDTEAPEE